MIQSFEDGGRREREMEGERFKEQTISLALLKKKSFYVKDNCFDR